MAVGDMISGIAAAAQATNDLGFGIYNAISQYRENQRNRDFAQQMAGYQNAVNRANWEAENRYNTPAMQLSRMRAAGINPALAMGGSQSLQLSGSNMQAAAPVNASPQVAPRLESHIDPLVAAQIRNIDADTRKKESDTKNVDADTKAKDLANRAEELIQNYHPYSYIDSSGEEVQVAGRNLRVENAVFENEMNRQGIQLNNTTLNQLVYDWYVLTGMYQDDDGVLKNFNTSDPTDIDWRQIKTTPEYQRSVQMLEGDRSLQQLSIDLAKLDFEAQQASKAGLDAFGKWIDQNKDNPLVQILLVLRGFLQTTGLSQIGSMFPRISVSPRKTIMNSDHIHYHKTIKSE